ncbi:MAG: hypothetical protein R2856_34380 [Caldilineaceae bacterium]
MAWRRSRRSRRADLAAAETLNGPGSSSTTNNGPGNYLVVLSEFAGNPSNAADFPADGVSSMSSWWVAEPVTACPFHCLPAPTPTTCFTTTAPPGSPLSP